MDTPVDEPENEADFEDFAMGADVIEIVQPSPLEFAPWHKPRKQYVRKFQWVKHAHGITNQLRAAGRWDERAPLKYLTLPGPDLLDVKLMAEVCSKEEIDLHYTGFCHSSETDADRLRKNIHQFSIEWGERIRPGSEIHAAKIEEVTVNRSSAKTLMERDGPYDIINIDACSPIANDDHNQTGRLVDAIRKIVEFQLESSRRPWMLYLTTPLQTDSISEQSLTSLHQQIIENAQNDPEFAAELNDQFEPNEDLGAYLLRVGALNGLNFVRAATLGVSKWLVHLASQANYGVKKLEGFCYSIFAAEPFEPNMISVCYLFVPEGLNITDETGFTMNEVGAERAEAVSDHLRALRRSYEMQNLDDKLAEDAELKAEMIAETIELLREAGYDVDHNEAGYSAWLTSLPLELAQAGLN